MRIDRLDLRAFGAFTDKTLDLSAGAAGLHLIYGDNEAGKSTSLRAIIAWLFGIPARSPDDYLHPHAQMRVGGKLRLADGRSLDFVRRKGNKDTLLHPDTLTALDDALLLPFLPASMNEELFKKFHGLDHERLEAGGKALLSQAGDLGQVLFSAATGIASSRLILENLENNAAELFKPTGTKPKVNQAIADFKKAKTRVKEFSLSVDAWKDLNKQRDSIEASIQAVDAAIQQASKEKSRLDRLNRVKGALGLRRDVLLRLQGLQEVLLLPEDFDDKRKQASDSLQTASDMQARAAAKRANLQQEAESLKVRYELLDNEAMIETIYRELGAVEKTVHDKPQQDGKRRLLRNDADGLLKEIRPDLKLDEAVQLRPLLKKKKWLADLAKKYSHLSQRKEAAATVLRDAEDNKQLIQQELAAQSPAVLDLIALKSAIAVARKAGNIEQRLADAAKYSASEHAACEQEFARLGRFSGTIDALLTLPLPVPETLDNFEQSLQSCANALREVTSKHQELSAELAQAQQALTTLLLTHDVPTLADLESVRDERNSVWQLLRRNYLDVQATQPDTELPLLYEQKVEASDHIADRLRLDADQVVKRADLEAKIQTLTARLTDLATNTEQSRTLEQTQQHVWAEIWQVLGINAGSPREMKQWLLRVEKLLTKLQTTQTLLSNTQTLSQECTRLQASIAAQLHQFEPSLDTAPLSLEAMLNLCEQRLAQEEGLRERQRHLNHALGEADIRSQRALSDSKAITNEQATWVTEWELAIEGLGLAPNAHPEYALETFEQLVAFFDKFDKSEEMRKRIWGMDKVLEEFQHMAFTFADSIGFPRDGIEASALATKLYGDLNAAREARASLTKLKDAEKAITEALQDADFTINAANQTLNALRATANVASDADLASAGGASRHKRALQQQLEKLEDELGRNGDGLSIAVLEQEASASDIDTIDALLYAVTTQLSELGKQRDTLLAQRQTVHDAIQAKDGSAAAANAAEEAEQHLTSVTAGVEQYLRFECARLILKQRIEDYRKKNQTPVLLRAGELFAKLTLGAYSSLRDDLVDGKPILLGVRPNNAEVWVERMSEGTRAQLYLSLRLATLEQQHSPHSEPMPLVVDDILIGFDDKRTRVGLEVLADVAQQTQVLLFTHHRRVLDLAATLYTPAGIFTHELA